MITLLAATLFASSIIEWNDPNAQEITIQAIVRLPKLGARDQAKLQVLARTIPKQTEDYARREMLMITGGAWVQCELTSEVLRISESVPANNLKGGLSLMDSFLRRATLYQEALDASAEQVDIKDYWSQALDPRVLPPVKMQRDDALALYHRIFRPSTVTIAVGGRLTPGEATEIWEKRMESWVPEPLPKERHDDSEPQVRTTNGSGITTIRYVAPAIPSGDPALSTEMLALFALGSGKGSSLFRIAREKHGWSYRQEAILVPTLEGWQLELLVASNPAEGAATKAESIKTELLEDVKAWTADDLNRALGMASAVLDRSIPFSPLYVLGDRPIGASLEDQTFWAGYWEMKTGKKWSPIALLESMNHVTLDDLKDRATTFLNGVKVTVLPGN